MMRQRLSRSNSRRHALEKLVLKTAVAAAQLVVVLLRVAWMLGQKC